jgi:adenosylcobinamide kinase/adenosylcobinamide-phosphate guanylyltransferase
MSAVALVLGGIRSGKSAFAEQLVERLAGTASVWYLATGVATDADMEERIGRHRARRPALWRTLEAPLNPTGALRSAIRQQLAESDDSRPSALLLDSVDGWVANLMFEYELAPAAELESRLVGAARQFVKDARQLDLHLVMVSSEVGQSLVATTPVGRRFQDLLGTVNQALATTADSVTLVAAGIPVTIKSAALSG